MLRILCLLLLALNVQAGQFTVHTNGDAHSRVLAKIFFPDAPILASPGADGLLVWKRLDNNSNDVAIQVAFAAHYLPLVSEKHNLTQPYELLATVAQTRQALVGRVDIKSFSRPVTVGSIGTACQVLLRPVFNTASVEMVYLPYKTQQEAVAAYLGGHIDFICAAAASLKQLTSNNQGKIVVDLTQHHKFMLTTQIFISKEMSVSQKTRLIELITRPLTTADENLAEANGFTLFVKTGSAAQNVFDKDRQIWRSILQK